QQKIAELDAFGHTVAHDLKNPLTVVKISIECLVKELRNYKDSKVVQKLTFINESTQHMVSIIESILLLAGINRTRTAQSTRFSMKKSVEDALQRLKYTVESNEVTIKKPDDWPEIYAYAPWITEVWVNYINNAIKYGGNPEKNIKPVIELGFDDLGSTPQKSHQIKFWVKDNGNGIEPDELPKLFKEFTRLHSGNTGHGLGLSIIKSIITKSNGDVGVESEIGKGSTFYFTLPVSKAAVTHHSNH
ncbi:MAG: HAMP domain-containing histidine kinase, partial [Fibrobacter sp.]|nr:HAMP domain-containing histidine kinase [Fibrobacter sp.]